MELDELGVIFINNPTHAFQYKIGEATQTWAFDGRQLIFQHPHPFPH